MQHLEYNSNKDCQSRQKTSDLLRQVINAVNFARNVKSVAVQVYHNTIDHVVCEVVIEGVFVNYIFIVIVFV